MSKLFADAVVPQLGTHQPTHTFAAMVGWGMAVPEHVLSNSDLESILETTSEWIEGRTGILERHIVGPGECTSTLATTAGQQAIEQANIDPATIDAIVLATCTPDRPFPSTACTIQANLGLVNASAFDIVAACSGFVYGLNVATALISSGFANTILFIAADTFTNYVDRQDRKTAVLFGDGAGAVVLQKTAEPSGMITSVLGASGEDEHLMIVEAGGSRLPATPELLSQGCQYVMMNGREVFRLAVHTMSAVAIQALEQAQLSLDDIALIVPHQANLRIIDAVTKQLKLTKDRVFVNLQHYGNTSAASIPIALCDAAKQGLIRSGDYVLLVAFGGGMTWGASIIKW